MHHPFTAPQQDHLDLLDVNALNCKALHYDIVLNGRELGGGSIRIHNHQLQMKIFRNIMKMSDQEISQFSHLLDALKYGCPPHGGIALGLDRLLMMLSGADNLREVIAFPKNGKGRDLCFNSPSELQGGSDV